MKALASLICFCLLLVACGDDGALSSAEREWCSFPDASEDSAVKFDIIFEAGLGLGLQMDALNAQAAVMTEENVATGMSVDEAARAVSDDLLEMDDYISSCQTAFASCSKYVNSTDAEDFCPVD